MMAYWFSNDAAMCIMFPESLGDAALKWFTRLPADQINNFRELVKQFTTRSITNSRVIKGPEALMNLMKKKKKGKTMCEYSSRYWETYQETEDYDLRFALKQF